MTLQLTSSSKLVRATSTRSNRAANSRSNLTVEGTSSAWTEKYRPKQVKDIPITTQKVKFEA